MKLQFTPIADDELARRLAALERHKSAAVERGLDYLSASYKPVRDAMDTAEGVGIRTAVDLSIAANIAEKVATAKATAEAVCDLEKAAREAPGLVRMIAQRLPASERPKGSRKPPARYRVMLEDGSTLVESTDHPLADGAAVLSAVHGLPDHAPVALRHAGQCYDRWGPMKLGAAAAYGIKRLADRTRLRELGKSEAA